jgi:hypothetical protein
MRSDVCRFVLVGQLVNWRVGQHASVPASQPVDQLTSRVLKNSLRSGEGGPDEIMHIADVLDCGSEAKMTLFASDVRKVQDGLFQQAAGGP